MIIDYLIYYQTLYYKERPQLLKWSTPLQRACHVVSASITFIIVSIIILIVGIFKTYSILDEQPIDIGTILIIWALLSFFIRYIYIKRDRYTLILVDKYKDKDNKSGPIYALTFFIISLLVLFIGTGLLDFLAHLAHNK